jgi:hypothetical protein
MSTFDAGRPGWWLGGACAAAALFTAAGGLTTSLAIAGVTILKAAADRRWRSAIFTLLVATLVIALGWATMSPPLTGHAHLKARNLTELLLAFANNLAWPWIGWPRIATVMWLPVLLLVATLGWRRGITTTFERLILGISFWVVLNAGAIAYARGGGSVHPAGRYMDFLSLGIIANAMALFAFLEQAKQRGSLRLVTTGAVAGWLLLTAVGVERLTDTSLADLGRWRTYFAAHTFNVRRFVLEGDRNELASKRGPEEIPHPDPLDLANILEDPYIRLILPAAVREPLRVESRTVSNEAFILDVPLPWRIHFAPLPRAWSSASAVGRKAQGHFESEPLACRATNRLKFQVAGYLGSDGQHLAIKNLRTGRDDLVTPSRVARETWTEAYVNCPSDAFEIVATDAAPDSWFAFQEPVEVGRWSSRSEWLISKSRTLLFIGLAMAVFAVRWS